MSKSIESNTDKRCCNEEMTQTMQMETMLSNPGNPPNRAILRQANRRVANSSRVSHLAFRVCYVSRIANRGTSKAAKRTSWSPSILQVHQASIAIVLNLV